jgi:hypothetical protein
MTHFTPKPLTYKLQDDIDPDGNGYVWAIKVLRTDGSYAQNPGYATSAGYAKMFAAAPELLQALIDVTADIEAYCEDHNSDHPTDVTVVLPKLQAAIHKATG